MEQRARAQPVEQIVPVRRGENVLQRVTFVNASESRSGDQQMQIVISKDRGCRVTERAHEAQRFERVRSAIDEVTDQPKAVMPGIETDQVEKLFKRLQTAL